MPQSPDKAARFNWPWRPIVPAAVLTAYLLSVGPVTWLAFHEIISIETYGTLWGTLYYPILLFARSSESAADWVYWYCGLFER